MNQIPSNLEKLPPAGNGSPESTAGGLASRLDFHGLRSQAQRGGPWVRDCELTELVPDAGLLRRWKAQGALLPFRQEKKSTLYTLALVWSVIRHAPLDPDGTPDPSAADRDAIDRAILGFLREKWPALIRQHEAAELFRDHCLFHRCVQVGWLRPQSKSARSVLYTMSDLLALMRRLERGVCPPALPQEEGEKPKQNQLANARP